MLQAISQVSQRTALSPEISTGATYGEFGDVKYIIAQDGGSYELILHGQDTGTFSLDIQESSGSVVTASSTIANVPTTPNTIVSLTLSGGISTASALTVDIDGDGKNVLTLTPKVGETVSYEPPAPAPAPQIISAGRGNRGASISEPVIVATTTHSIDSGQASSTATTTNPTATSTPVIAISTKPAKEKKKSPAPAVAIVQKENKNIPQTPLEIRFLTGQTASVYSASQQPVFAKLGRAVYNGLHGFWLALKNFF